MVKKVFVCNYSATSGCHGGCLKCKWLAKAKIVDLDQLEDSADSSDYHVCDCG